MCSENKGADQLRGYRKADLHLCFRMCKKPVFSRRGSDKNLIPKQKYKILMMFSFLQETVWSNR